MFKKDAVEYKATLKEDELEYISESVAVNKTLEFIKANNKPAAKRTPAKKKAAEAETEPQAEEAENAEN